MADEGSGAMTRVPGASSRGRRRAMVVTVALTAGAGVLGVLDLVSADPAHAVLAEAVATANDGTSNKAKKAKAAKAKAAKAKAEKSSPTGRTSSLAAGTAVVTIGGNRIEARADTTCEAGDGLAGPSARVFWGTGAGLEVRIQVGMRSPSILVIKSTGSSFDTWWEASSAYAAQGAKFGSVTITKGGAEGTATAVAPMAEETTTEATTQVDFAFRC